MCFCSDLLLIQCHCHPYYKTVCLLAIEWIRHFSTHRPNSHFVVCYRLITIRYTAPVENIFWKRDAMKPLGQKIVKLMLDMNFDANPIIIHVFSNGGAYLYQHIDLAIKEYQIPLDVSQTHVADFCLYLTVNLTIRLNCFVIFIPQQTFFLCVFADLWCNFWFSSRWP